MRFDDLVGLPYKDGGRGPDAYDCAGLLAELYRRRGIDIGIPDTPVREERKALLMLRIKQAKWEPVEHGHLGVAVFFHPRHVGVMIDRFRFIHASEEAGDVRIEELRDPRWKGKFAGLFEYAGHCR